MRMICVSVPMYILCGRTANREHRPMTSLSFSRSPVALAVAAALWTAAGPGTAAEETRLATIAVTEEEEPSQVERASSPKYTASLTDTPQTISVVTQQTIAEQ